MGPGKAVDVSIVWVGAAPDVPGGGLAVWVVVAAMMVLLAGSSLRIVAEAERVVVSRLGRTVRVAGPGPVFRVPLLERCRTVSLRPVRLELGVSATTRDGTPVHLHAAMLCRVTDPGRSAIASPDPFAATVTEVQSRLAREVARTDVVALLPSRTQFELDLPPSVTAVTATWGVDVIEVEVTDIEARLTPDLLNSLRWQPSAVRE